MPLRNWEVNDLKTEELESGLKRYEVIAPLLGDDLEPAQKRWLRKEIVEKHGISERTLRRYLRKYGEKGYEGLVKRQRGDKGGSKRLSADVLQEAIKLRCAGNFQGGARAGLSRFSNRRASPRPARLRRAPCRVN